MTPRERALRRDQIARARLKLMENFIPVPVSRPPRPVKPPSPVVVPEIPKSAGDVPCPRCGDLEPAANTHCSGCGARLFFGKHALKSLARRPS